jgi:undecaprenyl-diphosphatase
VRAWLAEREDRRGWRPFVRAAGPLWRRLGRPAAAGAEEAARFSWQRLTPGALGLELTTMLALLAVGAFAFFLIGDSFDNGALRRADDAAASLARSLHSRALERVAEIVTAFGSLPVVGAIVVITAGWAAWRRRRIDAIALIAGLGLSYAAVHIAKAAVDRPRPTGGLVDTMLSAYPSGHAAYAVSLVACATVLVRAGTGWAVRVGAITVAVALVAAVAVTRVYLGAHYFTDVLGGVALGVAVWAFVACVALVVAYVRHNDGSP